MPLGSASSRLGGPRTNTVDACGPGLNEAFTENIVGLGSEPFASTLPMHTGVGPKKEKKKEKLHRAFRAAHCAMDDSQPSHLASRVCGRHVK